MTGFSAIREASSEKRSIASERLSALSASHPVCVSTTQTTSASAPMTAAPTSSLRSGGQRLRAPLALFGDQLRDLLGRLARVREPELLAVRVHEQQLVRVVAVAQLAIGRLRAAIQAPLGIGPERAGEDVQLEAERDQERKPDRHRRAQRGRPEQPREHEHGQHDPQRGQCAGNPKAIRRVCARRVAAQRATTRR